MACALGMDVDIVYVMLPMSRSYSHSPRVRSLRARTHTWTDVSFITGVVWRLSVKPVPTLQLHRLFCKPTLSQ